MDTTTASVITEESPMPHRRVRADLAAGIVLLTTVIGGHLLWQASDAGILSAFGTH